MASYVDNRTMGGTTYSTNKPSTTPTTTQKTPTPSSYVNSRVNNSGGVLYNPPSTSSSGVNNVNASRVAQANAIGQAEKAEAQRQAESQNKHYTTQELANIYGQGANRVANPPSGGDGYNGGGVSVATTMAPAYSDIVNSVISRLQSENDALQKEQLALIERNGKLNQDSLNARWNKYKNLWRKTYNPNLNKGSGISNYLSGASDFADMSAENTRNTQDATYEAKSKFADKDLEIFSRFLPYLFQ